MQSHPIKQRGGHFFSNILKHQLAASSSQGGQIPKKIPQFVNRIISSKKKIKFFSIAQEE